MWNLIASNRVLDIRWKKENQRKHIRNLRNMKSQIDNSAPKYCSFVYSKPKTKQLQRQRQSQIQHENSRLVQRMLKGQCAIDADNPIFFKESLNTPYIRKKEREIDEQNRGIVKRLQSAHSQYSGREMGKYIDQYEKLKSQMASEQKHPFYNLQTAKPKGKRSSRSRPFSAHH